MIQTIYKGTDLVFNIKLEDKDGIPFRVRNTLNLYLDFTPQTQQSL